MTPTNDTKDFDLVFSEMDERRPADARPLVLRVALLIVTLVMISGALVYWALGNRERELVSDLRERSQILAATRAQVLETWVDSLARSGQRLSGSEVFRLFAAEVELGGGLPAQGTPLAAQMPYMIRAITEFAGQEGLIGAYLIDRQGRAVLASGAAPALTAAQRDAAVAVYASKKRMVTAARAHAGGLVADVILPVAPPQEQTPAAPRTVAGVFLFTVPVQGALSDLLKPSPLLGPGERIRLIQFSGEGAAALDPEGQPGLARIDWPDAPAVGKPLSFGLRRAAGGEAPVFSSGAWVGGLPWLVVHEAESGVALAAYREFRWGVVGLALAVTLLLAAAVAAFWWHQASENSQALAGQYRTLAGRIDAQRRFLEGVMNNLTEMVGLKGSSGAYAYVNPSFAKAVARSQEALAGLDDAEVFGRGTAEVLAASDRQARDEGRPVMAERAIHLPEGPRFLQFTKVPYRGEDGSIGGILSVARDVTELREAEAKRQAAFQQMTRALVRTIEAVDPYLAGQTQHVRDVGLAIAEGLGLGSDEVATIDIAAMLCQIGKVSVPADIVAKPGRLTDEERAIMQSHVAHALEILKGVDFGLPVVDALAEMYERLDGSGYPNGLAGDHIGLPARILAVADVFTARIERRSYREAVSPEEALGVLAGNAGRYDAGVVEALGRYLGTVAGEKLILQIGRG
jgi:PAS domain S-box-containing protein